MDLDDLLSQQFDVSDALEPAPRAVLASACQQLDRAPARRSLAPAEAARLDGERHKALEQALAATRELVAPSGFDLQVLAVLMRLAVEVHGVVGVRSALALVVKLIDQSWSALGRGRELAESLERDKLDRRRGSYLDAVFAQIYFWLAHERERSAAELGQAFASDRAGWQALVGAVDGGLARSSARISRWEPTRQALEACLSAPQAPPADAAPRSEAPPPVSAEAPPSAVIPAGATALIDVSARFWELQRRLAAFGTLLEGGQFEKARIVAHDLSRTLEQFDVAGYFPALFASYFELSARHADALTGPELDNVRRSALAELYRTDLTRFLQLSLARHA